jgi:gliding motility-associated-like protein
MIRLLFLISAFILPLSASWAQVSDSFEDGDFSTNPEWNGSSDDFIVNGNLELQLDNDIASQSFLATTFSDQSLDEMEWRFWVKQSFSGSANNQSRIYLSSLTGMYSYSGTSGSGAEGYFIQLGEGGSDDAIKLFRDDALEGATALIAEGTSGLISSSFEIRLQILRDGSGNWTIAVDEAGGENFTIEATGFDDTYSSSTNLGITCSYTISNSTNFYFDDIFFGPVIQDEEAPLLTDAVVIDELHLDATFNEILDETTSEISGNYSVAGIGESSSAQIDDLDASLVHLTFTTPFEANTSYTLEASGVQDLSGNSALTSADFIWISFGEPDYRSIVINEIMADPTPELGLPDAEFVELLNTGDESFQLENLEYVNSETVKVLPDYILQPGEFVLLSDDDNVGVLSAYGGVIGIPSFTAIVNSGDSLTLQKMDGTVIDNVSFNDSWYNDPDKADGGWTLEQINPLAVCSGQSNWIASEHEDGGTPGNENSVLDESSDSEGPEILLVSSPNTETLVVQFSEPLSEESIELLAFSVEPAIPISSFELSSDQTTVILFFGESLQVGTGYILSVSEIADCGGNISTDLIFDFVIGEEPSSGTVIINEIMADPDDGIPSPNAEYVELYNRSNGMIDISNISLSGGHFNESVIMQPGSYLIVYSDDDDAFFVPYPNAVGMTFFPGLTNTGRELELLDQNDDILDYVFYSDDWYKDFDKDDGGWSLELINPNDPCSDGDNWTASTAIYGATAGEVNSVFSETADENNPEALYALIHSGTDIEVVFDEQIDPSSTDADQWQLFINPDILAGTDVINAFVAGTDNKSVWLELSSNLEEGVVYRLESSGIQDCWGNESSIGSLIIAFPEEASAGDLIINEILFNPVEGGADYVEILNKSGNIISLEGWLLANFDDGIIDNFEVLSDLPRIIFSGEHVAFTTDALATLKQYPNGQPNQLLELDDLPSFNNESGTVYLFSPQLELSDEFSFDEDMHFALIDDLNGVSLERINPDLPSESDANWHSAAQTHNFGTPGYLNSQTQISDGPSGEITVVPEVFSPDNDGIDDVTMIHYIAEHPGNLANVTVFDRYGRVVRELVRNELLGISTHFSWDGTTDDRKKAPIGIYLIHFELFDLEGNTTHYKLTCVLGHQLSD